MATITELFDQAGRHFHSGNHDAAVTLIRQAIALNPANPDSHFNLGIVLKKQGQLAEATLSFRQVLLLDHRNARAHFHLGNVLKDQGLMAEAALSYRQALAYDPRHADAQNNLGIILKQEGQLAEAVQCYRQALCGNPRHADAHNNLGIALLEQGQLADAVACFRQAVAGNPLLADAHVNLGNALNEQGELSEAANCYRQALQVNPRHAVAHLNLGVILVDFGQFQEAREHYEHALRILPGNATALWNRSLLRLLEGDFAGGWRDFEKRFALPNKTVRSFQQPRWDGAPLEGKTILVHAEGGVGSTIQFLRYLPLVKARGGAVLFECPSALLPLSAGMDGPNQVIAAGAPLPPYDVQVPLLSLPGIFDTTLATIPAKIPYLRADPSLVEYWRKELGPLDGFRIGIVWQGNPANKDDRFRSIPLAIFEVLARMAGVRLLSLQVGPGTEQLAAAAFPVTDLGARFDRSSFGDLAAVLMNLDLVIAVETAVAHLAGALGVPAWVMLSIAGDWRWLRERTDSPWYPTLRLFRQSRFGDWDEVLGRIAAEPRLTSLRRLAESFDLALQYQQKGDSRQAEELCRQVVEAEPSHAAAHHLLGILALQAGRHDEAARLIRQAIALNPANDECYFNLGIVLMIQGQPMEAIACYRQTLRLNPGHAMAHNNLANILRDQGQVAEAILCYREALRINPRLAPVNYNLGNALKDQDQAAEAALYYQQALAANPNDADAHNNLGVIHKTQGQLAEAALCYREALRINPQHADAHHNLGSVLLERGQLAEAADCFQEALRINPLLADAHFNLGNAFLKRGQLDEAIACIQRARQLNPEKEAYHGALLGTLHYHPGYDAPAIDQEHRSWNRRHAEPLARFIEPHAHDPSPNRRLRIGYVSPDLHEHPVARFLLPLLEAHDHESTHIICYSGVRTPDTITVRCRACADEWRDVGALSDERFDSLIRQDRVDILVDLTMHMTDNRLLVFARKPAPVQVAYLAYCGTTGLGTMDYRLTDPYLDPPGLEGRYYSEQSIWLPETYWCFRPVLPTPAVAPLPALGAGHITFGCLNNSCKVTEPTLAAWSRLLQALPRSRLLLHVPPGDRRDQVCAFFAQQNIAPGRLTFVGFVPPGDYYQLYERMDVALDPFPFGGGTTTCDALWMGVPVVSLAGPTAVGRGGLSILSNVGLADLVARDIEQYVRIALELAGDLPRLNELRATMRARMQNSPLMDAARFAWSVEAAYRSMWQGWCTLQSS